MLSTVPVVHRCETSCRLTKATLWWVNSGLGHVIGQAEHLTETGDLCEAHHGGRRMLDAQGTSFVTGATCQTDENAKPARIDERDIPDVDQNRAGARRQGADGLFEKRCSVGIDLTAQGPTARSGVDRQPFANHVHRRIISRRAPARTMADQVASAAVASNRWVEMIEENPEHSSWYVERFRSMAAAGNDLDGEARFVDAMLARGSRVLDAGCGPGRVGGRLAQLGHEVVGVDFDPVLIAAAEEDHPGPTWLVADLAELDLPAVGIDDGFDVVVCAGNVVAFLAPDTRRPVLKRLAAHMNPAGRIVIGFGAGREYPFDEFFDDLDQVGLVAGVRLSTWDLRPFSPEADFLVAIIST